MKTLKSTLVILAAAVVGFGIYFMLRLSFDMRTIMGAANANKTIETLANPMNRIWIGAGIALLAGLLLGLGVGLPSKRSSVIRRDTLREAADEREASIRDAALRRSPQPGGGAKSAGEVPRDAGRGGGAEVPPHGGGANDGAERPTPPEGHR